MKLTPAEPSPAPVRLFRPALRLLAAGLLCWATAWPALAQNVPEATTTTGPLRLRQPAQPDTAPRQDSSARPAQGNPQNQSNQGNQANQPTTAAQPVDDLPPLPPPALQLGEFEAYVQKQRSGGRIRRFGADLINGLYSPVEGNDYSPLVPPDYLLRAGDELVVTLWGSVDADLRLQVDRSGRISIPRVGPVMVSGVRYGDLPDVISRRVAQVFKNYQLSVTLGQLRGLRVYVTGFVLKPGAQMVNSLSTVAQALMGAGGPSPAGSFRNIQLRRGRDLVSSFDLYDLLLKGDRSADALLQADDVIHVGPIGSQVALIGSVNRPAIFELKPSETVEDLLRMAGGFSPVADQARLLIDRFADQTQGRSRQLDWPDSARVLPSNGDVLRALNAADITQPSGRSNKRVRVEGEVARPGEYILAPASSLADALQAAGGITTNAYLYGTSFTRESVRITQQQNYERALRDFETQLNSSTATRRTSTTEEASALAVSNTANLRLIETLRALKPNGRIVLQLTPASDSLPPLAVEDGDRLVVPPKPTTVGVFGSVFSAGSYLHTNKRTVGEYLRLAGGPTRGGDDASIFVIRANGTVSSSLQESGFFSRGNQIAGLLAEPGDTIFVPEELNKSTWVQNAKDWTQILYQFGIGLAGIKSAVQ